MAIDPAMVLEVRKEWMNAPRGQKSQVVKKWADIAGCTAKTLYKYLNTGRKRRSGDRRIKDIEHYALIVHQIKKCVPGDNGELSTDQALALAIDDGLVPDSLWGKVSTINRIGRDLGMNMRQRRIQRYQAERPNQLHHMDASSSRFFYIHREIGDGDYALRLHAGNKGYKNKPVPIRLRPWVYGLTDDHSGVFMARYYAAYGESSLDNLVFLDWAWRHKESSEFFGVPEMIKADQGPLVKSDLSKEFLEGRLNIEIDGSEPGVKEPHGKIERPWRTVWQRFEKPFFACRDWRKFEISLSELNQRFMLFLDECNDRRHRYERGLSRIQAWKRVAHSGGAIAIPDNALSTAVNRIERTVGSDGCFSIDNVIYEVKGLHAARVWVYQGIFNDKMAVQDQRTGKKYEALEFNPNPVGKYTGHPDPPHQKAKAASADLDLSTGNTLYTKKKPAGNVVNMPTPVKETIDLPDPLDINTYPDLAVAMQDFISISGVVRLEKENREAIRNLILENGLSRQFVTDLALEIQVENNRRIS